MKRTGSFKETVRAAIYGANDAIARYRALAFPNKRQFELRLNEYIAEARSKLRPDARMSENDLRAQAAERLNRELVGQLPGARQSASRAVANLQATIAKTAAAARRLDVPPLPPPQLTDQERSDSLLSAGIRTELRPMHRLFAITTRTILTQNLRVEYADVPAARRLEVLREMEAAAREAEGAAGVVEKITPAEAAALRAEAADRLFVAAFLEDGLTRELAEAKPSGTTPTEIATSKGHLADLQRQFAATQAGRLDAEDAAALQTWDQESAAVANGWTATVRNGHIIEDRGAVQPTDDTPVPA
jgi:hypothetical protein